MGLKQKKYKSLFISNITIYIENPKQVIKEKLEVLSDFIKALG